MLLTAICMCASAKIIYSVHVLHYKQLQDYKIQ